MLLIYLGLIINGVLCYYWIISKKKNMKKTGREETTFDIWDNLFWGICVFFGILGAIGFIYEIIKTTF
jgi:cyanate permease